MKPEELIERNFESGFVFSTSRSSGPGGQNVNKVNTRVELRYDIINTVLLTEEEKQLINEKLRKRINNDGFLIITSQSERSQLGNKKIVIEKFYDLLAKALTTSPSRKPTKATLSSKMERLENKKRRSGIKKLRSGDFLE